MGENRSYLWTSKGSTRVLPDLPSSVDSPGDLSGICGGLTPAPMTRRDSAQRRRVAEMPNDKQVPQESPVKRQIGPAWNDASICPAVGGGCNALGSPCQINTLLAFVSIIGVLVYWLVGRRLRQSRSSLRRDTMADLEA